MFFHVIEKTIQFRCIIVRDNNYSPGIKMGEYSTRIDMTGRKIGRLTPLYPERVGKKTLYWHCLCDCGNTKMVLGSSLRNGETRSCGCLRKEIAHKRMWGGYEDLSRTYFNTIEYGANERGHEFSVTIEEMWDLYVSQGKKCALTGLNIVMAKKHNYKEQTASLDRIDSSKGYTKNNIQWVHKKINMMKRDLTDYEFINWCGLVYNHSLSER